MDIDPMEMAEQANEEEETPRSEDDRRRLRLNTLVAITVAILATFMGICKVKADNVAQAMQVAQSKSVSSWAWYQAKKIRIQFAETTLDQFDIQRASANATVQALIDTKIAKTKEYLIRQTKETDEVKTTAEGYDKEYERLNVHDDQFDLSDALLAISIALFAMTSLTQKRWLFGLALIPTAIGVIFGFAGLLNAGLKAEVFSRLLGA